MAVKKTIHFTLGAVESGGVHEGHYTVGKVARFTWGELYHCLALLKENVMEAEFRDQLDILLQSNKDLIHGFLWDTLQRLENAVIVNRDIGLVCGWVIACYGYLHQLPAGTENTGKWPHPAPLQKQVTQYEVPDWQSKLICPVCHRKYKPAKNLVNKDAILRGYGRWLSKHMQRVRH